MNSTSTQETSSSPAMVEMPSPPSGNPLKVVWQLAGAHGVLLAFGIGVGEWVLGPSLAIGKDLRWMWVATLSIILQVVFNGVSARFAAGTGQSFIAAEVGRGARRAKGPVGPSLYLLAALLQIGWPVYVATLAPVLHALWKGTEVAVDAPVNKWIAIGTYAFCMLILVARFGSTTVMTVLKVVNFVLVLYIVAFLFSANIAFVPAAQWLKTLSGFFAVGYFGGGSQIDWSLVGAVVGYAGAGGVANVMLASMVRDEGLGMAIRQGAVTVGFGGGRSLDLRPVPWNEADPEQAGRWKRWVRLIWTYQIIIFGVFSFLAMYLSVNLAAGTLPPGTNMTTVAFGILQARRLADAVPVLWYLTLLNAFAILFSSQISAVAMLVQMGTELVTAASGGKIEGRRARHVATGILTAYVVASVVILLFGIAQPTLAKLAANTAGVVLGAACLHLYWLEARIGGAVRSPRWVSALLLAGTVVFAGLGGYGLIHSL